MGSLDREVQHFSQLRVDVTRRSPLVGSICYWPVSPALWQPSLPQHLFKGDPHPCLEQRWSRTFPATQIITSGQSTEGCTNWDALGVKALKFFLLHPSPSPTPPPAALAVALCPPARSLCKVKLLILYNEVWELVQWLWNVPPPSHSWSF